MGAMNLDAVEARLFGSSSGLNEIVDDSVDFDRRQFPGRKFKNRVIDGGGGDRRSSGQSFFCLTAGMGNLQENL